MSSASPKFQLWLSGLKTHARWGFAFTIFLILAITGAIGTLVYITITPRPGENFTEFYITDVRGRAKDYPLVVALGREAKVKLVIVNNENQTMDYRVEITFNGEKIDEMGPIRLDNRRKWEQEVGFTAKKAGEGQRLEFLLYKGQSRQPNLSLYLWIRTR